MVAIQHPPHRTRSVRPSEVGRLTIPVSRLPVLYRSMKSLHQRLPFDLRHTLAGLLAVTIFAMGLMATAPNLHEELHHDAHHPEHSCAIDQFAQGVTPFTPVDFGLTPSFLSDQFEASFASIDLVAVAFRQPPGRAPPFVSIPVV